MDQHVSPSEGYLLALEPLDGTVRVEFNGEIIAQSDRVIALHESRLMPAYYFSMEDVRTEFVVPSELTSRCAFKGDAGYWNVQVGDRLEANAAWGYENPDENVAAIAGHIAFYWDRMDAWYLNGDAIEAPESGIPRRPA